MNKCIRVRRIVSKIDILSVFIMTKRVFGFSEGLPKNRIFEYKTSPNDNSVHPSLLPSCAAMFNTKEICFNGNGYTCKGGNTVKTVFAFLVYKDLLFKKKKMLLRR